MSTAQYFLVQTLKVVSIQCKQLNRKFQTLQTTLALIGSLINEMHFYVMFMLEYHRKR